ncbi:MAG: DinB family protein [Acidimicrobiales bacterium]
MTTGEGRGAGDHDGPGGEQDANDTPLPAAEYTRRVAEVARADLGARLRASAAQWRADLGRGELATERPAPEVWSAAEYGAHLRDVTQLFRRRIEQALRKSNPKFKDWDHEKAAAAYGSEDPARIAYDLASAAGRTADMLDRVSGADWDRPAAGPGDRTWTVETLARHLLYENIHHLGDVARGYRELRGEDDPGTGDDPGDGPGPGPAAANGAA